MRKFFILPAFFAATFLGFLFALIVSLFVYNHHTKQAYLATQNKPVVYAALPTTQNSFTTDIAQSDGRTEKLRQFFARYNSPLEPYAEDVVLAADEYGLDFRLISAIAMQESGLCKKIPHESYNCWGFGIYGKKVTRFSDYREGIYTVSKALGTRYKGKGLVTPDEIESMYTPPSNGSWAFSVNHFMAQLQ